jgi:hypothetical protein
MDGCKCGESAVDAEEHYIRTTGNLTILQSHKCTEGVSGKLTVGNMYIFYAYDKDTNTVAVKDDNGEMRSYFRDRWQE